MKRVVILIVLALIIAAAASIDCVGFAPGIYGVC
jgi:hypothetical protein